MGNPLQNKTFKQLMEVRYAFEIALNDRHFFEAVMKFGCLLQF